MDPRWRNFLLCSLAAALGVVFGWMIADAVFWPAGLAAAAILGLVLERWRRGGPELALLMFLLAGYVLGNRGFAQISVAGNLPVFFGELGLAAGLAIVITRGATRREPPIRRDLLNGAVLLWLVAGTMRFAGDIGVYGVMALRDFAVIYYAGFFFIAQAVATRDGGEPWLRRTLLVAVAPLPVLYWLSERFPAFFFHTLTVRGAPLIYYKEDLVAAFLCGGFFLLLAGGTGRWRWRWVRGLLAAGALGVTLSIPSSRAALAGLAVAGAWWLAARRTRPLFWAAGTLAAGAMVFAVYGAWSDTRFADTKAGAVVERVESMADFSGHGHYHNAESVSEGDNNRFRRVWWGTVADDVRAHGPLLGLGFGYDLAKNFVQAYDPEMGDDFTTRSPHSIVMTMVGRMGAVGLLMFLALAAAMTRDTWRAVRALRREATEAAEQRLAWWSVAWVILTSACLGVVLEGPMGAVVFWTALGVANTLSDARPATVATPARAAGAETPVETLRSAAE